MDETRINAYELIAKQRIEELETDGYILKHKKTGARVVLMENKDENKVFYIGFRTPPKESTGVMHILEHSVLCGSKNYPVKDPFIELAKGSLNTFLNAMTFPDKTVYPVASCNDKDFRNLMHVYLDAVFYPNILNSDKTFRQEGWHYELEDVDSELTINGVVYSEMKGVFSSPDDVLEREIFNSLFPDTPYSEESGGDPNVIPDLTYEHYIDIYKTYYHPSNSYIYLYGDMDMADQLEFIDREYLGKFDAIEIDSSLPTQKPFDMPLEIEKEYSITESEPTEENAYVSYNCAFSDNMNTMEYIAWQVIDYALCSAQGAVLKQALLDAGLGKDIYNYYENGIKQPYFSIVSKGIDEKRKDEFVDKVREVLGEVVKNGFNKDALRAGLNSLEFRYREADFGNYPAGLMYGLQALDSWLYDDELPFIHLSADATFKALRERIDTDYYERLVETKLINNNHRSTVTVKPCVGMTAREEEKLKKKLADYKASLSKKQLEQLVKDTIDLREYQEALDDPEALKTIPLLEISDLKKETQKLHNDTRVIEGKTALFHPIHTNGIDYVRLIFDMDKVPARLFPYLCFFKNFIGVMDTANYSYQELFNKIFMETGGINPVINVYEKHGDRNSCRPTFEWKAKCLSGGLDKVFDILTEIILNTKFDNEKRIKELLGEIVAQSQSSMISAGHSVARQRACSYFSVAGAYSEMLSGMEAYKKFEEIYKDFDNRKGELIESITELSSYIFAADNLMFDFTGSDEEYKVFAEHAKVLLNKISQSVKNTEETFVPNPTNRNEAFTCASQVQYVCRAGNFSEKGFKYTGALRVLRVILGYDYLWNNVRVKGGAYGCMSGFTMNGDAFFVSYRDPNLQGTMDIFEKVVDYVSKFDADDREMTQYIIGAVSELDMPLTPAAKALRSLSSYMTGKDDDIYQKERDELLATTPESLRELASHMQAILDTNSMCVVGNEDKIRAEGGAYKVVLPLFEA